ncbi:MAG: antitoxin [Betaproteobacteria bacterium]|nr:MAG: antitoxin [Betaproteobacteria bacterium]
MRTTLDIDDDILSASKELAKAAGKTAGQVISELARKALTDRNEQTPVDSQRPRATFGIQPLPHRGGIVTTEMVRQLMDEEGI